MKNQKHFVLIFLALLFIKTANAATFQQSWTSCQNTIAATPISSSFSDRYCQTVGALVKFQRLCAGSGCTIGVVYTHSSYSFTGNQCSSGYAVPNDRSNDCQIQCVSPQIRDAATNTCINPITCTAPETYHSITNSCEVNECSLPQILNTTTGLCQTPPNCASTEKYNNATNTCFLSKLQCPDHSHASQDNTQCLADPPVACPSGQHDDGTYTCIANDATRCSSDHYSGDINGNPGCIKKPNISASMKAAQDAYAPRLAAEAAELQKRLEYYDARDAYLQAQKASDDDPLDAQKAAAASAAYDSLTSAEDQLASAQTATETARTNQQASQQKLSSEVQSSTERNTAALGEKVDSSNTKLDSANSTLTSIDNTLKSTGNLGTGDQTTGINTLGTLATNSLDNSTAATQAGSWFSSMPTMPEPGACVTIPMNYKALQYTLNPCDKLAPFREMFAYFLYVATTIFIIKIAVRPQ